MYVPAINSLAQVILVLAPPVTRWPPGALPVAWAWYTLDSLSTYNATFIPVTVKLFKVNSDSIRDLVIRVVKKLSSCTSSSSMSPLTFNGRATNITMCETVHDSRPTTRWCSLHKWFLKSTSASLYVSLTICSAMQWLIGRAYKSLTQWVLFKSTTRSVSFSSPMTLTMNDIDYLTMWILLLQVEVQCSVNNWYIMTEPTSCEVLQFERRSRHRGGESEDKLLGAR